MKNKKIIFIFNLLLFFIPKALSGQGVVTAWEAPLFIQQSFDSTILQRIRKGAVIYIHQKHFMEDSFLIEFKRTDPYDISDLFPEQAPVKNGRKDQSEEFYTTVDTTGVTAYVPKKFVKLITNDEREESTNVRPYKYDPSDYRLPEPIPENYPFHLERGYRGQVLTGIGTQDKGTYDFPQSLKSPTYGKKVEFNLTYGKKSDIDQFKLIYFGALLTFQNVTNSYSFANELSASEKKTKFGIGPFLSYDTFNKGRHKASIFGGFIFYLQDKVTIFQKNTPGMQEERTFSGRFIGSKIGLLYQYLDALPSLDFLLGTSIQLDPPHTLQSKELVANKSFWNQSNPDQIHKNFQAELSFFIGFQFSDD